MKRLITALVITFILLIGIGAILWVAASFVWLRVITGVEVANFLFGDAVSGRLSFLLLLIITVVIYFALELEEGEVDNKKVGGNEQVQE